MEQCVTETIDNVTGLYIGGGVVDTNEASSLSAHQRLFLFVNVFVQAIKGPGIMFYCTLYLESLYFFELESQ